MSDINKAWRRREWMGVGVAGSAIVWMGLGIAVA